MAAPATKVPKTAAAMILFFIVDFVETGNIPNTD
jgi:hypothetical protein